MALKTNKTAFGTKVQIARSGEVGTITGFAQHMRSRQPQYFVEYTDALACAREGWFSKDELAEVSV